VTGRACCLFRSTAGVYKRDEFLSGLGRHGFAGQPMPLRTPTPADVLLIWNRIPAFEQYIRPYETVGARVIVTENGYIHGRDGAKRYALALGQHNGAGKWPVGAPERLEKLNLELHPWRSGGESVLLLPQRGIGARGVAMPPQWAHQALAALKGGTRRPVAFRRHPGPLKTEPYAELAQAHCAVTWGSGAAIKALAFGVPVFHGFPAWIGGSAALRLDGADLERPKMDDGARLAMFQGLAWAQWEISEISSGEAFAWLMNL
jgi:hypothetical protein